MGRWTKRTAAALRKKPDAWGFLHAGDQAFRGTISEGTRGQVITLLNVVEQALATVGMAWEPDEKSGAVVGKLYGESVSFSIAERNTRTEHIERDPKYSWADKKTYTYDFSGDLTLRIEGWYDGRKSWSDGKTQRLIEKLPEVVEGFIAAADALRRKKIELEEQRQRWAEEHASVRNKTESKGKNRNSLRSRSRKPTTGCRQMPFAATLLISVNELRMRASP